jgi:hypothetical protein
MPVSAVTRIPLYVAVGFFLCTTVAAALHTPPYVFEHGEPVLFEQVGPQEERADNPWAAAAVVTGMLLAGYSIYVVHHDSGKDLPFSRNISQIGLKMVDEQEEEHR